MTHRTYIKTFLILFFLAIFLVAGVFAVRRVRAPASQQSTVASQQLPAPSNQPTSSADTQPAADNKIQNNPQTVDPIDNALGRITKKPFGIYITPKTSPVQPERFQGYHTGTDLETTQAEQNIDVPVVALCEGKLLSARFASGYGGVMVQSCTLNGQAVTVIYGHLRWASIKNKVGDQLKAGDFLANLGTGFSSETNGERKHLHLAVHLGTSINILGYVQNKNELNGWLDPAQFL